MKKVTLLILLISLIIYPAVASAQVDIYSNYPNELTRPTWAPQQSGSNSRTADVISRYRYYRLFQPLAGSIPEVVEVALPDGDYYSNSDFALVEDSTTTLQSFEIIRKNDETKKTPHQIQAIDNSGITSVRNVNDGNFDTFSDFPLSSQSQAEAALRFVYDQPITAESVSLFFDSNSSFPTTYSLEAIDSNGKKEIVISETPFDHFIRFPKRTSSVWDLKLKYNQPLRISEIMFPESISDISYKNSIRFLMRPGSPYLLFSGRDGLVNMPYLEAGNFSGVTDVTTISLPTEVPNPSYVPADEDLDGISDTVDNCPSVKNAEQKDENRNSQGDACEDFDKDYILNGVDNCPEHPNRDQQDADGDKVGDHCDSEESRLTERLGFLPWLGIIVGFGVVIAMFAFTVRKPVVVPQKEVNKP